MTSYQEKFHVDLSHNYNDLNGAKREKLIASYYTLLAKSSETDALDSGKFKDERAIFAAVYQAEAVKLEEFERLVLAIKAPQFEEKDSLIETLVRYSITYLEEFNYDLKLRGLTLIDHLTAQIGHAQLNANLRLKLLVESLERYLHDKDSHAFLDRILATMCSCLAAYETTQSSSVTGFKKHSLILDSMLSNCYMTSDTQVKVIYYAHIPAYTRQMGTFACRHLDKMLTICFECSEHLQTGFFDFSAKQLLLSKAIDLLQSVVRQLHLRVHSHSKRIINFLIRLIYFATCSLAVGDELNELVGKMVALVEELFENPRVRELHLAEFRALVNSSAKSEQNQAFHAAINHIC